MKYPLKVTSIELEKRVIIAKCLIYSSVVERWWNLRGKGTVRLTNIMKKPPAKAESNGIISEKPNKNEIKQPIETEERTINTINNLINKKTNKLIN